MKRGLEEAGHVSPGDSYPSGSAARTEEQSDRAMLDLLLAATGAPPRTRILPVAAAGLAGSAGLGRATLMLYDRRKLLVAGTSRTADGTLDAGLWAVFRSLHPSVPAVASALRGEQTRIFLEPESASALGPGDWVGRFGARTVVVLPLLAGRRVVGVAVVDDERRGALDPDRIPALERFASVAAHVFDLLEAVEVERRLRARTELVVETTEAAARAIGTPGALSAVVTGIHRLTGDHLVVAATVGDHSHVEWIGDARTARLAVDAIEMVGGAHNMSEATILDLSAERWADLAALGHERALLAPLRHRNRELGWVLSLGASSIRYGDDDRRAVGAIVDHASVALNTAGLLEAERQTVERLTEIDRLKSTFVAAVSHELRTPLTAVVGFAELLAEELDDAALLAHLDDLRRESAVLEALIGNLLDTSRLEAGMLQLNVHPTDLRETIGQAIEVVRHGHPERPIDLLGPERMRPIRADAVRLRQVFLNLIENAAKYSPAGTPVVVTVDPPEPEDDSGCVTITVDDQGPGIPSEDRAVVFERFRRLGHHEQNPGTGIGLYIVKALIDAHGGSVAIEDGPDGVGTRFRIALPVVPSAA